jgi:hypothetical protein
VSAAPELGKRGVRALSFEVRYYVSIHRVFGPFVKTILRGRDLKIGVI